MSRKPKDLPKSLKRRLLKVMGEEPATFPVDVKHSDTRGRDRMTQSQVILTGVMDKRSKKVFFTTKGGKVVTFDGEWRAHGVKLSPRKPKTVRILKKK